jgi:hypothetical protein
MDTDLRRYDGVASFKSEEFGRFWALPGDRSHTSR